VERTEIDEGVRCEIEVGDQGSDHIQLGWNSFAINPNITARSKLKQLLRLVLHLLSYGLAYLASSHLELQTSRYDSLIEECGLSRPVPIQDNRNT
jgi:hypothetical protein